MSQLMSPTSPLVSVILPIKDCNSCFLEKSVGSILGQTLTDLELLVIIDADTYSIDKQVLNVFEKFDDERIRIVPSKKEGFVEALNTGILAAKGTYLARMDGDDISSLDRLKLQIEIIEREKVDFVGGWAYVIDEQGETVGTLMPPTDARQIKRMIMLHNPFLHSSVTFKKSILKHSGLYNPALFGAEDYDLWLRIVSLGYTCINMSNFVLYLREARNSIVRGSMWQKTRTNYAKAKVLGLARLGYTDPLSIASCLAGPFSVMIGPDTALHLKSLLRWFEKTSYNQ